MFCFYAIPRRKSNRTIIEDSDPATFKVTDDGGQVGEDKNFNILKASKYKLPDEKLKHQ